MKVLHVNEHLARKGGVETYLLSLLPLLNARGVDTHVVYGSGDPTLVEQSDAVPAIGIASWSRQKEAYRGLASILDRESPDLVHVHNVQNTGALAAALDYGPVVLTTHDYRLMCPASTQFFKRTQEVCHRTCGPACFGITAVKHCLTPRPLPASYFYARSKWAIRHAASFARLIAPCADARDRFVRAGFDSSRINVLPYFCPVEPSIVPRPVPRVPTITFLGRIAPNKGQEYFVEALGLLPASVKGIMAGNLTEESSSSMLALAEKFGCRDRLELQPWASREEVKVILDQTSVFVFPSLWPETLGIVGLEALARGVPVVASDVGGVREWLRDGENGYLVPPKDAGRIAESVARILDDPARIKAFGQRGIETIRSRFLPETHVDALLRVYECALSAVPSVSAAVGG